MATFYLVLLILSAACFVLATLGVVHKYINFLALGLLFWVLVPLIQRF